MSRVSDFRLQDILAGHDSVSETLLAEDLREARARITELERENDVRMLAYQERINERDSALARCAMLKNAATLALCSINEQAGSISVPAMEALAEAAAATEADVADWLKERDERAMKEEMMACAAIARREAEAAARYLSTKPYDKAEAWGSTVAAENIEKAIRARGKERGEP